MVALIFALLSFSPHTKTSLKPTPLTSIPHRRVWLESPQVCQPYRHTRRHLLSIRALQMCLANAGFLIAPATTQWPRRSSSLGIVPLVKVLSSAGCFIAISDAGTHCGICARGCPPPPSKADELWGSQDNAFLPSFYCHPFLAEDTEIASCSFPWFSESTSESHSDTVHGLGWREDTTNYRHVTGASVLWPQNSFLLNRPPPFLIKSPLRSAQSTHPVREPTCCSAMPGFQQWLTWLQTTKCSFLSEMIDKTTEQPLDR